MKTSCRPRRQQRKQKQHNEHLRLLRGVAPTRGVNARMKHPFARARAMRACSHCRAAEWCAKQTK